MAYESWAGGNISGGADATSWSLKPRGGYVPLADIPNVPKTVDMPMLQYPKMPSIRYEPVKGEVDMASRAQKLMQKELPGSFEEAGNIRAAEAGKGQMAMGKAIAGVGADISKALGSVSEVLGKFAHQGLKDKDEADQHIFANNIIDYEGRRNEIYQTLPADQWPDALAKAGEDFSKKNAGLGVFPKTKDDIQSRTKGYIAGTEWGRKIETAKKMSTDAINLYKSEIEDGRANNDIGMMNRGVAGLEAGNHITHEQAQHEYGVNNTKFGMFVAEQALKSPEDARDVMEDAKRVTEGQPAQKYDVFNKNPALAKQYLYASQEAIKGHKNDGFAEYDRMNKAGEPVDESVIRKIGEKAGWSNDTIQAVQATHRKANAPMMPGEHVRIREGINGFDPQTDTDGEKYAKLYTDIEANIDQPNRARFHQLLDSKRDAQAKDPTHHAQQSEATATHATIKERRENGLLVKPEFRTDLFSARAKEKERDAAIQKDIKDHPKRDEKKTKESIDKIRKQFSLTGREQDALNDDDKTSNDLHYKADAFHDKNPDFKEGEMSEHIFGKGTEAQKKTQENAGKAAGIRTATPVSPSQSSAVPDSDLDNILASPVLANVRTGPRDIGGRTGNEAYQAAFVSNGDRYDMEATAYTKFEPGGDKVKVRSGPLFTMEKYQRGLVPYVSAAMDDASDLQGKYLISTSHPNVVFKVEDRGGAFVGKGNSRIDIAYDNRKMETEYKSHGTWKVITEAEAAKINGTAGMGTASAGPTSAGPIQITNAVDPNYAAMSRPRSTSQISKIVVHGDVKTSVPDLISYAKQVDRGYHYYIATDGRITMVVPPDYIANHIKGANSDSIGIVIAGADNGKMPTHAQDVAAKLLISRLAKQYGISPQNVAGHGERQPDRRDPREGGNIARDVRERGFI